MNKITITELLKRSGWTKTVLKKIGYLLKPYPIQMKSKVVTYFDFKEVLRAEKTVTFKSFVASNKIRTDAAAKAINTMRIDACNYGESCKIKIKKISIARLEKQAKDIFKITFGSKSFQDLVKNPNALQSIVLNYIREHLTTFSIDPNEFYGKVGYKKGYEILFNRVRDEAFKIYPWLDDEYYQY
ncbi:hypothetical protein M9Y82_17085 [Leptospira weilii]|uniref:Uncharacterized protein n=2 Tax=Leptospira weilii TaxID=28184 RepID=M6G1I9_9LEPT|nr:hypothetical protein [Leptospira weilii]EMM72811.1 hypothetical protein LEP1GSC038_2073 [Leptospira weilii str. 2006001855]MCL8268313.1 hypothetical protein [Leptospira weilii]